MNAPAFGAIITANTYYAERKTLNTVIPSAARNLVDVAARCLAALGMTPAPSAVEGFNLFRSH